jgi:uncharacterized membrane-anchored protein
MFSFLYSSSGARRRSFGVALLTATLLPFSAAATPPPAPAAVDSAAVAKAQLDSLNASFHYETGRVNLPGNLGVIDVPKGMHFLDSAQAHFVLMKLWGNPPSAAASTLGLLFPLGSGPASDGTWAFVVDYEEMGYVKDDDADDINYDELLTDMKEGTSSNNAERTKAGYEPIELLGWASPPYYDKEHHVLHWAKLLQFGTDSSDARRTLNYDVRVLGRKGVLSLLAVGDPALLPAIKQQIPNLISNAHFSDGLEYSDFDPGMDDVAAYSLGGLVAGKVLAKVGFFALILKFWKVLIAAGAGAFTVVRRWFAGRRSADETPAIEAGDGPPAPPVA